MRLMKRKTSVSGVRSHELYISKIVAKCLTYCAAEAVELVGTFFYYIKNIQHA